MIRVFIAMIVPVAFGLAAVTVGSWEVAKNCFWPPAFMSDEWAWRLSSIPLAAMIIVLGSGLVALILFLVWGWALHWDAADATEGENGMSAKCSSCGAEIVWAMTVNDKAIPLDMLEKRFILHFIRNVERGDYYEAQMVETYVSHFATCPNAAKHRRKP